MVGAVAVPLCPHAEYRRTLGELGAVPAVKLPKVAPSSLYRVVDAAPVSWLPALEYPLDGVDGESGTSISQFVYHPVLTHGCCACAYFDVFNRRSGS